MIRVLLPSQISTARTSHRLALEAAHTIPMRTRFRSQEDVAGAAVHAIDEGGGALTSSLLVSLHEVHEVVEELGEIAWIEDEIAELGRVIVLVLGRGLQRREYGLLDAFVAEEEGANPRGAPFTVIVVDVAEE